MAETEQNGAKPATESTPSGAPDQVVADVDMGHPAVDSDPRAGTTAEQNRIDFNDPTISGEEASRRALGYGKPGETAPKGKKA